MGKSLTYVVPIIELRRAIYRACEETYSDKDVVDFMYSRIIKVAEDKITSSCHEYNPDKIEIKWRLK